MSEENLSAKPIGCWWIHRGSQITCSCSCGETGMCSSVHLLVLWTWNALFVDVSTISLYFTNMFWAECLQIPAAAVRCPLVRESRIWAERGWRGVTYCGRGSPHYSARGALTIIWPLSPVAAPENEHFHSTVSFKLPH